MASRIAKSGKPRSTGNLRIGDHWNAITIIALSQSNPLKAVAELVENSIDARARTIVITRGKEKGQHYLRVKDDGEGVRRNADGEPDFHYVATHVCDSIKRRLKTQGTPGLQGCPIPPNEPRSNSGYGANSQIDSAGGCWWSTRASLHAGACSSAHRKRMADRCL